MSAQRKNSNLQDRLRSNASLESSLLLYRDQPVMQRYVLKKKKSLKFEQVTTSPPKTCMSKKLTSNSETPNKKLPFQGNTTSQHFAPVLYPNKLDGNVKSKHIPISSNNSKNFKCITQFKHKTNDFKRIFLRNELDSFKLHLRTDHSSEKDYDDQDIYERSENFETNSQNKNLGNLLCGWDENGIHYWLQKINKHFKESANGDYSNESSLRFDLYKFDPSKCNNIYKNERLQEYNIHKNYNGNVLKNNLEQFALNGSSVNKENQIISPKGYYKCISIMNGSGDSRICDPNIKHLMKAKFDFNYNKEQYFKRIIYSYNTCEIKLNLPEEMNFSNRNKLNKNGIEKSKIPGLTVHHSIDSCRKFPVELEKPNFIKSPKSDRNLPVDKELLPGGNFITDTDPCFFNTCGLISNFESEDSSTSSYNKSDGKMNTQRSLSHETDSDSLESQVPKSKLQVPKYDFQVPQNTPTTSRGGECLNTNINPSYISLDNDVLIQTSSFCAVESSNSKLSKICLPASDDRLSSTLSSQTDHEKIHDIQPYKCKSLQYLKIDNKSPRKSRLLCLQTNTKMKRKNQATFLINLPSGFAKHASKVYLGRFGKKVVVIDGSSFQAAGKCTGISVKYKTPVCYRLLIIGFSVMSILIVFLLIEDALDTIRNTKEGYWL